MFLWILVLETINNKNPMYLHNSKMAATEIVILCFFCHISTYIWNFSVI